VRGTAPRCLRGRDCAGGHRTDVRHLGTATEPEAPSTGTDEASGTQGATEASGACDREARDFELTAVNFAFEGSITDACPGDTVTLTIDNGSHSFTASEAGVDTGVFGEGSMTVTLDAEPGTYSYNCTVHPSQMRGEFTLQG
jgi:plastocyanin